MGEGMGVDELTITFNPSLERIDGLAGLTSVASLMIINGNDALVSLDGLDAITEVGWILQIHDNATLVDLAGLGSLQAVGGTLSIHGNATLGHLGLGSLVSLGESYDPDLLVTQNQQLPTCEAEALRDQLQAAGWEGEWSIAGNDDEATCEE
jgi:hypothetical protein